MFSRDDVYLYSEGIRVSNYMGQCVPMNLFSNVISACGKVSYFHLMVLVSSWLVVLVLGCSWLLLVAPGGCCNTMVKPEMRKSLHPAGV